MSDVMSARRRALLIFFLLVMFGALAVGYLLTFHLDTVRRAVQQQMMDAFGQNLLVGDIQVAFFPSPTLTLTNLQILEFKQGEPVFHAARIQVDLGVLSVLQDEFVPKSLMIEDPEIYLRRSEEGQWNIETVMQNQSDGSSGVGALLTDYTLNIENGRVHIVDAFENAPPESVEFSSVTLHISNLSARKPMDVLFSAILNHNEASQLSLQGTISDAQDFFATPQENETPSGPNVDVRTHVELNQSDLIQLTKLFHIPDMPPLHQGRVKAQSQIRFGPGIQGYDLVISNLVMLSDSIDLQGKASIAGLMTAIPPTMSPVPEDTGMESYIPVKS